MLVPPVSYVQVVFNDAMNNKNGYQSYFCMYSEQAFLCSTLISNALHVHYKNVAWQCGIASYTMVSYMH